MKLALILAYIIGTTTFLFAMCQAAARGDTPDDLADRLINADDPHTARLFNATHGGEQ